MTIKRAVAIYLAVFLLALPLTFPLSLLLHLVELPDGVAIAEPEGSLFSAKLDWVSVGGLRAEQVSLHPSLSGAFSGTPVAVSVARPVALKARLGGTEEGAVLRDLSLSTQLSEVGELLSIPTFGADAAIGLSVDKAEFAGERCTSLSGRLSLGKWQGAMDGLDQLDTLTATLDCENGRLLAKVQPDNAIRLSGTAHVFGSGRYQVNMTAEPPPGPLFDTFVDLLGEPRDGRRFVIRVRS